MARIELAPETTDDFDRILDHLAKHEVEDAQSRIQGILDALDVLSDSPEIGRPIRQKKGGLRELIIGRRSRGYVALYRYVEEIDVVFVLAIRSQREAGYAR